MMETDFMMQDNNMKEERDYYKNLADQFAAEIEGGMAKNEKLIEKVLERDRKIKKLEEKYNHTVERCGRFASRLYKTRGQRREAAQKIKGLIDIQKQNGNYNYNEFMFGMLIGMETAYYSLLGEEAKFTEQPKKWLKDGILNDFVPEVVEGSLDTSS